MIRLSDDVHVMFDKDHGVALISKLQQRRHQSFGVTRMQANRWFVKYITGAQQTGSETGRQARPLEFAPRKCSGRSI